MSDMLVEKAEVGKITLRSEDPRITPKNIAEGDIDIAIRDVIREIQEERLSPTANAFVESAFKRYQERYLNVGKNPDLTKFLPEDLYHTMRLEGEKVTRKQAYALFK